MKTNQLRKFIKSQLDSVLTSYFKEAPDNAMFPHCVFDFKDINISDLSRDDYMLEVDLWGKDQEFEVQGFADQICEKFNFANLPNDETLPTFFRDARKNVPDDNKTINHIYIRFLVETYDQ